MKNPTKAELNTIGETVKAAKFDNMYLPPSASPYPVYGPALPPSASPYPVIRDNGPEYERRKWLRDMVTTPLPAYAYPVPFTNR